MKKLVFDVGLFSYELKPVELIWAALQGGAAFVIATTSAPVSPQDWQAWVIALGAAAVRPAVAVVFGKRPAP